MAFPRGVPDDDDLMGDSVCSTLSDCSLLECNRGFHSQSRLSQHQQLPPADGDCLDAADVSDISDVGDIGNDDDHGDPTVVVESSDQDCATYRSAVMRQFRDDIDRLAQTVTQRVGCSGCSASGSSHEQSASNPTIVYSAVKSGCLSLLLSRVLPPLLERFEQRLIGSLLSSGILPPAPTMARNQRSLPACVKADVSTSRPTQSLQPPPPHTQPPPPHTQPPRPAPRLRSGAKSATSQAPPPPPPPALLPLPIPPPPSPPRPLPQKPVPASTPYLTPTIRRLRQSQSHPVRSPYFTAHTAQKAPPASTAVVPVPVGVRNNSSLKPSVTTSSALPTHRQPPAPSCSDLVRIFMVRDSPSLREILFDPDDRKMKSVSQRYGCYISVFEKTRRAGHLLHKVVVRAPSEKSLRMCINALDSGLNWDLASQLNRASKKATSLAATSTR